MRILFAFLASTLAANTAWADTLTVTDGFFRVASPIAKAGAAFITIENNGEKDDQLIGVKSEIARMVQLHTHQMDGDVMKMIHVEDGFTIPAGESFAMQRGGDHVMFMGLAEAPKHGDEIKVILVFENAGELEYIIPVDLARKGTHSGH